jgi:four helix bundle protein
MANGELRMANERFMNAAGRIRSVGNLDAPEILGGGRIDIHKRTFELAVRVLRMVDALPRTTAGYAVARQLSRSGTSIGANVEEAQGAHSRAEFARRMGIACYWIRVIEASGLIARSRVRLIRREAEEIGRILTAIVKKARTK